MPVSVRYAHPFGDTMATLVKEHPTGVRVVRTTHGDVEVLDGSNGVVGVYGPGAFVTADIRSEPAAPEAIDDAVLRASQITFYGPADGFTDTADPAGPDGDAAADEDDDAIVGLVDKLLAAVERRANRNRSIDTPDGRDPGRCATDCCGG
ncbi:hypothetical protein [Pseudonocardia sp. NPDC049635]|uniref:hypothetical protein n=1 Tax=Pseudonocardia sp. NPDC049635 TaxID=3155506 RepID=UPI0033C4020C